MNRREEAYGQSRPRSFLDKLGEYLSKRRLKAEAGLHLLGDFADIGCGYEALLSRPWAGLSKSLCLVDLALDPALKELPKTRCLVGRLPQVLRPLKPGSFDLILLNSVLEHLEEPELLLTRSFELLRPGGRLLVNVPNWLGKRALEFSAFQLGSSSALEIDDHRCYYDPRDLWPLLVKAGFRPRQIHLFRHKLFLNTFARCDKA